MPPSIQSLPPELILLVARALDPFTCLHFALTCRLYADLCNSLLTKHKTLSDRYATIDGVDSGRLVWNLLRNIIRDPDIANYIRVIHLPYNRQDTWKANQPLQQDRDECPEQMSDKRAAALLKAMKRQPVWQQLQNTRSFYDGYFFGDDWNFEQSVRIGSDEPIIVSLLALAHNLETLCFATTSLEAEITQFLYHVTAAYAGGRENSMQLPFERLTCIIIDCDADDRHAPRGEWLLSVFGLPSLKKFAAYGMGGDLGAYQDFEMGDDAKAMSKANGRKSSVKEVLLDNCDLGPFLLEHIIDKTAALEKFSHESYPTERGGCFTPRSIAEALLRNASHSLEELTLTCSDAWSQYCEDIDYVSLQGFQKLRALRCNWVLISGEPEESDDEHTTLEENDEHATGSDTPSLGDILPVSLRALCLDQATEWEDADGLDSSCWLVALTEMLQSPHNYVPNLRAIYSNSWANDNPLISSQVQSFIGAIRERNITFESLLITESKSIDPLGTCPLGHLLRNLVEGRNYGN